VGIKPVEGGQVDANSYKLNSGSVTCKNVLKEINKEFTWQSTHYPVQWDEENKMWIVDFVDD